MPDPRFRSLLEPSHGEGGDPLVSLLHTTVSLVRLEGADLTSRQMAVLLTCYLVQGPHTVRGLAARLGLPKAAVSRSLDRLQSIGLAQRAPEPGDGRGVVVARTDAGRGYLLRLRRIAADSDIAAASRAAA